VDKAMAADGLAGLETMWWTYQEKAYFEVAPFVTANAVMWPRTLVIFANTARMAKLDKAARDWVTHAAADASTWSTTHAADADAQHIERACRFGARIALATPEQLAALRKAAEPAYAAIRANPALATTLQRVEGLTAAAGHDAPITVPAGCAYQPGDETRLVPPVAQHLTGPGAPGELPPGVYRYSVSTAELRALGETEHDATMNAGVLTWTLRGGSWSSRLDAANAPASSGTCEGWYDVRGDAVTFVTTTVVPGGTCAPPVWTARWSAHNGTLAWSAVSVADFAPGFASKPWQKIG